MIIAFFLVAIVVVIGLVVFLPQPIVEYEINYPPLPREEHQARYEAIGNGFQLTLNNFPLFKFKHGAYIGTDPKKYRGANKTIPSLCCSKKRDETWSY